MPADRVRPVHDPPRRNIELKAVDPSPDASIQVCARIGARDHGTIWQRDTYFEVPAGRLKLREEDPGSPHLIQYTRGDGQEARESRYRIAPVADADALRAVLEACLGVRVVVVKYRHLFLWRRVRIHIDEVDGLGSFVELEAVADPGSDLALEHQLISELRAKLAISDDRLISVGYADQLVDLREP
jgi:predicted adenylyl cyclase CyaB